MTAANRIISRLLVTGLISLVAVNCMTFGTRGEARFSYKKLKEQIYGEGLGNPIPLTVSKGDNVSGSISPDGRYLYYSSNRDGRYNIWIRDLETVKTIPITFNATPDRDPVISPTGEFIAYVTEKEDPDGDIAIMEVDPEDLFDAYAREGTTQAAVEPPVILTGYGKERHRVRDREPAWSKNSAWLAYTSVRKGQDKGEFFGTENIWVISPGAPELNRQITTEGGVSPAFAPDDKSIVFVRFRKSESTGDIVSDIYRIGFDPETGKTSGTEEKISTTPGLNLSPTFMPKGKAIIYLNINRDTNNDGSIDRRDGGRIVKHQFKTNLVSELTLNDEPFFGIRHSTFLDGTLVFSKAERGDINLYFTPHRGVIPQRNQIQAQYRLTRQFFNKNPEKYPLALSKMEEFWKDSPIYPLYFPLVARDKIALLEQQAEDIQLTLTRAGYGSYFKKPLKGVKQDQQLSEQKAKSNYKIYQDTLAQIDSLKQAVAAKKAYVNSDLLSKLYGGKISATETQSLLEKELALIHPNLFQPAEPEPKTTGEEEVSPSEESNQTENSLNETDPADGPVAEDSPTDTDEESGAIEIEEEEEEEEVSSTPVEKAAENGSDSTVTVTGETETSPEAEMAPKAELSPEEILAQRLAVPEEDWPENHTQALKNLRAELLEGDWSDLLNSEPLKDLSGIELIERVYGMRQYASFLREKLAESYRDTGDSEKAIATLEILLKEHPRYFKALGAQNELAALKQSGLQFDIAPEYREVLTNPKTNLALRSRYQKNVLDILDSQVTTENYTELEEVLQKPENESQPEIRLIYEYLITLNLYRSRQYEAALERANKNLKKAVKENFLNFQFLILRGDIQEKMGLYFNSLSSYRKAVLSYQKQWPVRVSRELFERVLFNYKRYVEKYLNRRDYDRAMKLQKEVVRLYGFLKENNILIKSIYDKESLEQNVLLARIFIFRTFRLADDNKMKKAHEDADTFYNRNIAKARANLDMSFIYGRAYYLSRFAINFETIKGDKISKGDKNTVLRSLAEADEDLSWVVFADPDFSEAYLLKGWFYQYIDEKRQQIVDRKNAVTEGEKFEGLYVKYFPYRLFEKNISLYEQSINLAGKDAPAQVVMKYNLNLANTFFLLRNFPKAFEKYELIAETMAEKPKLSFFESDKQKALFHFHYGRAAYYNDKNILASRQIEIALNYYRDFAEPTRRQYRRMHRIRNSLSKRKRRQHEDLRGRWQMALGRIALITHYKFLTQVAHTVKLDFIARESDRKLAKDALETGRLLLKYRRTSSYDFDLVPVYLELSRLSRLLLDYKKSDRYLKRAAKILKDRDDDYLEKDYPVKISLFYIIPKFPIFFLGQDSMVIGDGRYPQPLPGIAQKELLAANRLELALARQDYPRAIRVLKKKVEILERDDSALGQKGLINAFNNLGYYSYLSGRLGKAAEYFNEAFELADDAEDLEAVLSNRINQVLVLSRRIETENIKFTQAKNLIERELESIDEFATEYVDRVVEQKLEEIRSSNPDYKFSRRQRLSVRRQARKALFPLLIQRGALYYYLGELYQNQAGIPGGNAEKVLGWLKTARHSVRQYREAHRIFNGVTKLPKQELSVEEAAEGTGEEKPVEFEDVDLATQTSRRMALILYLNQGRIAQKLGYVDTDEFTKKQIQSLKATDAPETEFKKLYRGAREYYQTGLDQALEFGELREVWRGQKLAGDLLLSENQRGEILSQLAASQAAKKEAAGQTGEGEPEAAENKPTEAAETTPGKGAPENPGSEKKTVKSPLELLPAPPTQEESRDRASRASRRYEAALRILAQNPDLQVEAGFLLTEFFENYIESLLAAGENEKALVALELKDKYRISSQFSLIEAPAFEKSVAGEIRTIIEGRKIVASAWREAAALKGQRLPADQIETALDEQRKLMDQAVDRIRAKNRFWADLFYPRVTLADIDAGRQNGALAMKTYLGNNALHLWFTNSKKLEYLNIPLNGRATERLLVDLGKSLDQGKQPNQKKWAQFWEKVAPAVWKKANGAEHLVISSDEKTTGLPWEQMPVNKGGEDSSLGREITISHAHSLAGLNEWQKNPRVNRFRVLAVNNVKQDSGLGDVPKLGGKISYKIIRRNKLYKYKQQGDSLEFRVNSEIGRETPYQDQSYLFSLPDSRKQLSAANLIKKESLFGQFSLYGVKPGSAGHYQTLGILAMAETKNTPTVLVFPRYWKKSTVKSLRQRIHNQTGKKSVSQVYREWVNEQLQSGKKWSQISGFRVYGHPGLAGQEFRAAALATRDRFGDRGQTFADRQDYRKARAFFEASIAATRQLEEHFSLSLDAARELAEIYIVRRGDSAKGEKFAASYVQAFQQNGQKEKLQELAYSLVRLFLRVNNNQLGQKYYKLLVSADASAESKARGRFPFVLNKMLFGNYFLAEENLGKLWDRLEDLPADQSFQISKSLGKAYFVNRRTGRAAYHFGRAADNAGSGLLKIAFQLARANTDILAGNKNQAAQTLKSLGNNNAVKSVEKFRHALELARYFYTIEFGSEEELTKAYASLHEYSMGHPVNQAGLQIMDAWQFIRLGQFEAAAEILDDASLTASLFPDESVETDAEPLDLPDYYWEIYYKSRGEVLTESQDAKSLLTFSKMVIDGTIFPGEKAWWYLWFGEKFHATGQYAVAAQYLENALQAIYKYGGNARLEKKTRFLLAKVNLSLEKFQTGLDFITKKNGDYNPPAGDFDRVNVEVVPDWKMDYLKKSLAVAAQGYETEQRQMVEDLISSVLKDRATDPAGTAEKLSEIKDILKIGLGYAVKNKQHGKIANLVFQRERIRLLVDHVLAGTNFSLAKVTSGAPAGDIQTIYPWHYDAWQGLQERLPKNQNLLINFSYGGQVFALASRNGIHKVALVHENEARLRELVRQLDNEVDLGLVQNSTWQNLQENYLEKLSIAPATETYVFNYGFLEFVPLQYRFSDADNTTDLKVLPVYYLNNPIRMANSDPVSQEILNVKLSYQTGQGNEKFSQTYYGKRHKFLRELEQARLKYSLIGNNFDTNQEARQLIVSGMPIYPDSLRGISLKSEQFATQKGDFWFYSGNYQTSEALSLDMPAHLRLRLDHLGPAGLYNLYDQTDIHHISLMETLARQTWKDKSLWLGYQEGIKEYRQDFELPNFWLGVRLVANSFVQPAEVKKEEPEAKETAKVQPPSEKEPEGGQAVSQTPEDGSPGAAGNNTPAAATN